MNEDNLSGDTFGDENVVLLEFTCVMQPVTPEMRSTPRYGVPDYRQYLADDQTPPEEPPTSEGPNS